MLVVQVKEEKKLRENNLSPTSADQILCFPILCTTTDFALWMLYISWKRWHDLSTRFFSIPKCIAVNRLPDFFCASARFMLYFDFNIAASTSFHLVSSSALRSECFSASSVYMYGNFVNYVQQLKIINSQRKNQLVCTCASDNWGIFQIILHPVAYFK